MADRRCGRSSRVRPAADLHLTGASDPVLDSSRTLAQLLSVRRGQLAWCDQEWTAKFNNVLGLSGEARGKGFQELWQIAYDQNVFIPLFGLNFIHGISPKLHWDPPRYGSDPRLHPVDARRLTARRGVTDPSRGQLSREEQTIERAVCAELGADRRLAEPKPGAAGC